MPLPLLRCYADADYADVAPRRHVIDADADAADLPITPLAAIAFLRRQPPLFSFAAAI